MIRKATFGFTWHSHMMPGFSCCSLVPSNVYNQHPGSDHTGYASVAVTCRLSCLDPFMFAYTKGECPLLPCPHRHFFTFTDNRAKQDDTRASAINALFWSSPPWGSDVQSVLPHLTRQWFGLTTNKSLLLVAQADGELCHGSIDNLWQ